MLCDGYRWDRSLKACGYSLLACGNSSLDLIHCCALHIVINTLSLSLTLKGGVSFLICEHGCRLWLLDINALFAEASQILQDVQVSLLQISLCHIADFWASRTVQSLLVFHIPSWLLHSCVKRVGWLAEEGFVDNFFNWDFLCFGLPKY